MTNALNTPFLWVGLPLIMAVIAALLHRRSVLNLVMVTLTSLALSLLAIFFPEDLTISIGRLTIIFNESLGFLGRQITITYKILPFISLMYAVTGLWSLSSNAPDVPWIFRPISLVITALFTAALGVTPFLYAALFIEIAVLVSIPILSPLDKRTDSGILRYLSLQSLALPFILLAGWLLTGVEALPPDSMLVGQILLTLGLGLALWLSVFPFHTWVPMVSQNAHPMMVTFLLFILPTNILIFSLNFLDQYPFLRTSIELYQTLRIIGTLMIMIGGAWTAFQQNLKRALGFSLVTEIGFSLLAVGLTAQGGITWLLMFFPARALGYWLWGYTLNLIEDHAGSADISWVAGLAKSYPLLSLGLIVAQLSIAGLPLLASFPIKIALLTADYEMNPNLGVWSFLGNLGLFVFTLRLLAALVTTPDTTQPVPWSKSEKPRQYLLMMTIILALILFGLFPHIFNTGLISILTAFTQLQ